MNKLHIVKKWYHKRQCVNKKFVFKPEAYFNMIYTIYCQRLVLHCGTKMKQNEGYIFRSILWNASSGLVHNFISQLTGFSHSEWSWRASTGTLFPREQNSDYVTAFGLLQKANAKVFTLDHYPILLAHWT